MQIFLIVLGVIAAAFGGMFLNRYLKLKKEYAKAIGRVVDCKKVAPSGKMPGGWQAIAEYEVGKKRIRGSAAVPIQTKYATGYKLELYYNKKQPQSFLLGAYVGAMKIYIVALPIGLALIAGGILWLVL